MIYYLVIDFALFFVASMSFNDQIYAPIQRNSNIYVLLAKAITHTLPRSLKSGIAPGARSLSSCHLTLADT